MSYNWNWGIFFQLSPDGTHTYWQLLLFGTGWTLATALSAWTIALLMGSFIGVLRTTSSPWLVRLGNAYVELFRNIPLLVQMFLWYFVLPEVVPAAIGDWLKQLSNASFYNAVICLGLYTSARVAEQVKAGILSLRSGQRMAGLAVGLTLPQTYRYVLLPMAFRIILPPLSSEFLNIIKNSSVALTIGLIELTAAARSMQEFSFQVFEAFTGATIIYIVINVVVVSGMQLLERRVAVPGFIGHSRRRQDTEVNDVFQYRLGCHRPFAAYLFFDGMRFTVILTLLATAGGIVIGTLLALMRFPASGARAAGRRLCEPHSFHAAGAGDFLVLLLVPYIGQWATGAERPIQVGAFWSVLVTFTLFEAAYFCEIMRAGIIRTRTAKRRPRRHRHDLSDRHGLYHPAAGFPQHGAGAADPNDHPVSGYFASLRYLGHRLSRRRIEDRPA